MFGLDELTAIIPPPANPEKTMRDEDWLRVFRDIGTRLPSDYVLTYNTYGAGWFYSRTHRWSASIHLWGKEFFPCVPDRLTKLRLTKERRPKNIPFPLYWEPGGLLPWASFKNDIDFCWRVRGELVDDWRVVVLRASVGEHEEFEMSAIQFLARVIAGSVTCSLLPKGFPGTKGVDFARPSELTAENGWK